MGEAMLLERSQRLDQENKPDSALAAVDVLVRLAPQSARAHLALARVACRRNALPEAQAHLDKVFTAALGRKAALLLRAEIRQRLGRHEDAQEDLRAAAAMKDDPPWPDPLSFSSPCRCS